MVYCCAYSSVYERPVVNCIFAGGGFNVSTLPNLDIEQVCAKLLPYFKLASLVPTPTEEATANEAACLTPKGAHGFLGFLMRLVLVICASADLIANTVSLMSMQFITSTIFLVPTNETIQEPLGVRIKFGVSSRLPLSITVIKLIRVADENRIKTPYIR